MKKKLVSAALLLGIAWDILFWKKIPGINFPIFVVTCLAVGYFLLRSGKLPPSRRSLLLLAPILFFSVMTFMRSDPLTSFLNYALSLLFFFILSATYQSGLWISYGFFDYIANAFHFIGNMFALPWKFLAEISTNRKLEKGQKRKNMIWRIFLGLFLALPILSIFTFLLSSADLIFEQKLQDFFAQLNIEKLGEYTARGILILSIAYFFIGMTRYAAVHSQREKLIGTDKPVITPFLGFPEGAVILGSVILLFITFVAVQFRYFFSGQTNINLDGFTYAEYARRGFGELVMVAVFSLLLIQGLRAVLKLEKTEQRKLFTGLVIGLVALVLVILVSAFQRLSLYESAYGFSSLRTYSHVFIIWLGLLLISIAILEILRQERAFANLALLATIGFALSLNLMNVDAFIVRQNVRRASGGEELDASYLASLSSDAVPALVRGFQSSAQSNEIQEGIGAALVCHRLAIENDSPHRKNWQSFHYSDWNATRNIETIQEHLIVS